MSASPDAPLRQPTQLHPGDLTSHPKVRVSSENVSVSLQVNKK